MFFLLTKHAPDPSPCFLTNVNIKKMFFFNEGFPNDYPGAVTLSHNNPATNLAIDRGPMVPANGRIGAKIRLKPHSCLSSQGDVSNGRQCDRFAATLFVQKSKI